MITTSDSLSAKRTSGPSTSRCRPNIRRSRKLGAKSRRTTWSNIFRFYRPGWGRYTQADPIGLRGEYHLYRYTGGNPLTYIDPRGLKKICCTEGSKRLFEDRDKNLKRVADLLTKGYIQLSSTPVAIAATACGSPANQPVPGIPATLFYPAYKKLGPCEQACTRVHEAQHASLCRQFGFYAYAGFQSDPANWAKEEALAYLTEARCLDLAARNGSIDPEEEFKYLGSIPEP